MRGGACPVPGQKAGVYKRGGDFPDGEGVPAVGISDGESGAGAHKGKHTGACVGA